MSEHVQAYHFVGATLRDGRPVPPDGEWLVHDGPVVLRESGLHASRRPWHALQHAPGPVLCLVEVDQVYEEQEKLLVARRRRIARRVDLTADLWAFARQCARDVLHLWDAPDVVWRYLDTGDETLRFAAWEAARDAEEEAAEAAWVAAGARAAASAARAAAGASAWVAAWEAADDAAWAAASAAAREPHGAWDAAQDAAQDAAWDAKKSAQGARFDALCRERLGVTAAS